MLEIEKVLISGDDGLRLGDHRAGKKLVVGRIFINDGEGKLLTGVDRCDLSQFAQERLRRLVNLGKPRSKLRIVKNPPDLIENLLGDTECNASPSDTLKNGGW